MAMYDLTVEEESSNSTRLTQCYEYIKKVINSNMEPIYSRPTPSKTDFIKIGTPYLLTNYKRSLKDGEYKNLYEQAKNNDNLKSLKKYLSYDDTDTAVNQKYGILRKDGGAMLENKIVNYSKYIELIDKIKYPDLYAAVYEILDIPGNLYNSAKVILNKVLHKDVLYFPFGLFSLKCEMLKKKYYWNLGSPKGITIMPSIGVGIYKTDKFIFSVRVQKENIPIWILLHLKLNLIVNL
ncbi:GSCOCT00014021001.2-RA-CDS [Cotesia congregata]|uniref:Cc_odve66_36 n=1 Tax=Cotesia congregata TaxID=51543 RepID=A0A8J2H421_COTCN|nr:GSCOCT00014021001.2-RA-CDS [Cotesia congregata]CAG5077217.1 Cc_odve66_36 [Cotesia congregata]